MAASVGASPTLPITAVTTAGSQANIEMVDAGEYDLGFVQSDVMSYAYSGTNLFLSLIHI